MELFSDGGPKHFKITGTMSFVCHLSAFLNIPIIYHFFETNHGHSVCDAAASQAKGSLNVYQRDFQIPVKTPTEIVNVIDQVAYHNASLCPIPEWPKEEFTTFRTIRSYHKFTFEGGKVHGWKFSESLAKSKTWNVAPSTFQFE
jgi:hypothetical protein